MATRISLRAVLLCTAGLIAQQVFGKQCNQMTFKFGQYDLTLKLNGEVQIPYSGESSKDGFQLAGLRNLAETDIEKLLITKLAPRIQNAASPLNSQTRLSVDKTKGWTGLRTVLQDWRWLDAQKDCQFKQRYPGGHLEYLLHKYRPNGAESTNCATKQMINAKGVLFVLTALDVLGVEEKGPGALKEWNGPSMLSAYFANMDVTTKTPADLWELAVKGTPERITVQTGDDFVEIEKPGVWKDIGPTLSELVFPLDWDPSAGGVNAVEAVLNEFRQVSVAKNDKNRYIRDMMYLGWNKGSSPKDAVCFTKATSHASHAVLLPNGANVVQLNLLSSDAIFHLSPQNGLNFRQAGLTGNSLVQIKRVLEPIVASQDGGGQISSASIKAARAYLKANQAALQGNDVRKFAAFDFITSLLDRIQKVNVSAILGMLNGENGLKDKIKTAKLFDNSFKSTRTSDKVKASYPQRAFVLNNELLKGFQDIAKELKNADVDASVKKLESGLKKTRNKDGTVLSFRSENLVLKMYDNALLLVNQALK